MAKKKKTATKVVKKKPVAKKAAKKPAPAKLKAKPAVAAKKTAKMGAAPKAAKKAGKAVKAAKPPAATSVLKVAKKMMKQVTDALKPIPTKEVKKAKAPKERPVATEEVVERIEITEEVVEEIILTDAQGRRYCRTRDCDQAAIVEGYCRYHYLLYWKKIQVRKKILDEGKLERYIEELTARYPDKFLEMLQKDLKTEKDFLAAIQELEIDESATEGEFEDETQSYIEEVRGITESGGGSAREEEDF